jgi:hypothetical protein
MVVSGGAGIAESMRKFVQFEGVPGDRIVVENRSGTTGECAFTGHSGADAGPESAGHSDMHTYRSVRAFRKGGRSGSTILSLRFKLYNSWPARWSCLSNSAWSGKIVSYRVRGWI